MVVFSVMILISFLLKLDIILESKRKLDERGIGETKLISKTKKNITSDHI
jgi:hypothetical protein